MTETFAIEIKETRETLEAVDANPTLLRLIIDYIANKVDFPL